MVYGQRDKAHEWGGYNADTLDHKTETRKLVDSLAETPDDGLLYHYTSLSALQNIVTSRRLRLTDIRFFNDASELQTAALLIQGYIARMKEDQAFQQPEGRADVPPS